MPYVSLGYAAQEAQLQVQQLNVSLEDNSVVSTSGSTATINCGQAVQEVRSCLFIDDSAGTVAPVTAANTTVSGSNVTLTLSAAMAAHDELRLDVILVS